MEAVPGNILKLFRINFKDEVYKYEKLQKDGRRYKI